MGWDLEIRKKLIPDRGVKKHRTTDPQQGINSPDARKKSLTNDQLEYGTYLPVCSSSWTEAARGSPSKTRAIIVIRTIFLPHVSSSRSTKSVKTQ
jgi:hypothetical protein